MSFSFRQTVPTARAIKADNIFAGKSTLRADEKKKDEGQPKNSALQEYLAKKYASDSGPKDGSEAGKRKKKRKAGQDASGAIRIVDQDLSGFVSLDSNGRGPLPKRRAIADDDEEEEEAPTIANPEEAAALMKQVDKAKSGSGWVAADEAALAGQSRRHDSPDASPPRRGRRDDSPDASPPRRGKRHDSPDASPPRRGKRHDSPDASPPRRGKRHDSPDASPPRRGKRHDSPDASPPRRGKRHDSPDASPPRRGKRHDSPDASPPRRGKRHDSPDASPPRRGKRHDSPDASPPRRGKRHDSPDASPPRRGKRHDSPDASPPRRGKRHDSPDASPPRRSRSPGTGTRPGAGAGMGPGRPMGPPRPPARMGDGTAAGLVSATQLAEDIKKQKEQAEERRRNAEGRGAQTVYRDKATGRVMTAEEALKAKEDERAARKKPSIYDEDQTLEWRGGLAQKRQAEERRRELEEEAAKPFARSDIDSRHDAALREQVRFGDPFAHLARRKQAGAEAEAVAAITERYDAEKLGKSGFKIPQEVPPHSWLKRGVAAPANRYNIRPGRHWDGVNRSNGFEEELFKSQSARAARELEARLWSMGDM
ncbi:hypothetical protein Agub_g8108 [Astrephomene gubernaculifera]|uniref:Uncharacterized protein n=1 Tax=Astrephomene gubernaculifera TaxID=47775 RepID=A0AAD3HMT6_9CHLO|nr:hypothetical protein Agub_g8108 [Astrephomene gubernaculifera]